MIDPYFLDAVFWWRPHEIPEKLFTTMLRALGDSSFAPLIPPTHSLLRSRSRSNDLQLRKYLAFRRENDHYSALVSKLDGQGIHDPQEWKRAWSAIYRGCGGRSKLVSFHEVRLKSRRVKEFSMVTIPCASLDRRSQRTPLPQVFEVQWTLFGWPKGGARALLESVAQPIRRLLMQLRPWMADVGWGNAYFAAWDAVARGRWPNHRCSLSYLSLGLIKKYRLRGEPTQGRWWRLQDGSMILDGSGKAPSISSEG